MAKTTQLAKARSLILGLEDDYGLDLGEFALRFKDYAYNDGLFTPKDGRPQISICRTLKGREFEAAVFHEAGHLFFYRYSIPKGCYSKFLGRKGSDLSKAEIEQHEDEETIPYGYVSLYAATENQEEDFCETFAAFLQNGGKTTGRITYEDFSMNLSSDPELRQKLNAVKEALESARRKSSKRPAKKRSNVVSMEEFRRETDWSYDSTAYSSAKDIGDANASEIERIKKLLSTQ